MAQCVLRELDRADYARELEVADEAQEGAMVACTDRSIDPDAEVVVPVPKCGLFFVR